MNSRVLYLGAAVAAFSIVLTGCEDKKLSEHIMECTPSAQLEYLSDHGASAAKKHTAECFEFYKTITPYCNDSSESAREKGRKFVETLTPEAKEAFTGTVCSVHSITGPVMGLFGGK